MSIMIRNLTKYSLKQIYAYLAGYETELRDKIEITNKEGRYYDYLIVKEI